MFCHTDPGLWLLSAKFAAFLWHFPCWGGHNEAFIPSKTERVRLCDITHRGLSACCCCLSLSCCLTIWLCLEEGWRVGGRQRMSLHPVSETETGMEKGSLVTVWKFKSTNQNRRVLQQGRKWRQRLPRRNGRRETTKDQWNIKKQK